VASWNDDDGCGVGRRALNKVTNNLKEGKLVMFLNVVSLLRGMLVSGRGNQMRRGTE
jgi:hypothetical protein